MHPETCTSSDSAELKQNSSSLSAVASAHLPFLTRPQYSKCPISSEKATLYEWAAHGTRVCSLEVAYIGWNAYGLCEQVSASGSKLTWANPLSTLAVIDPDSALVRSLTSTTRPSAESWIDRSS